MRKPLPPAARDIFEKATTGPTDPGHGWDKEHARYNKEVKKLWDQYLKKEKINPKRMTKKQAENFLKEGKDFHEAGN